MSSKFASVITEESLIVTVCNVPSINLQEHHIELSPEDATSSSTKIVKSSAWVNVTVLSELVTVNVNLGIVNCLISSSSENVYLKDTSPVAEI